PSKPRTRASKLKMPRPTPPAVASCNGRFACTRHRRSMTAPRAHAPAVQPAASTPSLSNTANVVSVAPALVQKATVAVNSSTAAQLEQPLHRMQVLLGWRVRFVGSPQRVHRIVQQLVDDPPGQFFQIFSLGFTYVRQLVERARELFLRQLVRALIQPIDHRSH